MGVGEGVGVGVGSGVGVDGAGVGGVGVGVSDGVGTDPDPFADSTGADVFSPEPQAANASSNALVNNDLAFTDFSPFSNHHELRRLSVVRRNVLAEPVYLARKASAGASVDSATQKRPFKRILRMLPGIVRCVRAWSCGLVHQTERRR